MTDSTTATFLIFVVALAIPAMFVARIVYTIMRSMRAGHTVRSDSRDEHDYSTATCPICGKYDESRPFVSYAIDCHRTDCQKL